MKELDMDICRGIGLFVGENEIALSDFDKFMRWRFKWMS